MNNFINTSKAIALLSFVIGTILFAIQLCFITPIGLIYSGIIFIVVAVIINTIALTALVFVLLGNTDNQSETIKTCGLILLNIPIAILYFYILIETL